MKTQTFIPTCARPRVDYQTTHHDEDPFPDSALLDTVDSVQHGDIRNALDEIISSVIGNNVAKTNSKVIQEAVNEHISIFRDFISLRPPAKVAEVVPLRIEINKDARAVRVRLWKCSQDQRALLQQFVSELLHTWMVYPSPTSAYVSSSLIIAKQGPFRFRFTEYFRPVNKYTVGHHFSMPNIEQELLKLWKSRFFATFDLSHRYWQLPPDESSQGVIRSSPTTEYTDPLSYPTAPPMRQHIFTQLSSQFSRPSRWNNFFTG